MYGTLRKGERNHSILQDSKYIGHTYIWGKLYKIGGFPGFVPDILGSVVVAEVYDVSQDVLNHLDDLEGVKHGMFQRRRIPTDDKGYVSVYVWPHPLPENQRIISGDWCNR